MKLSKPTISFALRFTLPFALLFSVLTLPALNTLAVAAPKSYLNKEHHLVLAGSKTQELIDKAVAKLFESPLKKSLCNVYANPTSLAFSAGVTKTSADRMMSTCAPEDLDATRLTKLMRKRYFLMFAEAPHVAIESWTTEYNETILWVYPGMTADAFERLIIHELAMSVDAKKGLLLTTYFKYEKLHVKQSTPELLWIEVPQQLSPLEVRLKSALNGAADRHIGFALAAMRGFYFEQMVLGLKRPTHKECSARFKDIFELIKTYPEEFMDNPNAIPASLVDAISKHIPQDMYEQTFKDLADPKFKLPNSGNVTFCQYMAYPLFSGKTLDSFYSGGPRTRPGGGWEATPSTGEVNEDVTTLFQEDLKYNRLQKYEGAK